VVAQLYQVLQIHLEVVVLVLVAMLSITQPVIILMETIQTEQVVMVVQVIFKLVALVLVLVQQVQVVMVVKVLEEAVVLR